MKIIVMNPPFVEKYARSMRCPAVTKSGTLVHPYWLLYSVGVLEEAGFDVTFIDAPAQNCSIHDVWMTVNKLKPDMVVLDTSTASIYNDCSVAETIKKTLQDCFIVMVGPHVSALPGETLKACNFINAVARREYDYTLRDLARVIETKGDLRTVLGLSFREDGNVIHNADRPYIENLDELPFISKVCKKHIDLKNYFYSADLYPLITVLGSRGCPYQCTYCLFPQTLTGHRYRVRSVGSLIEEVKYILKEFPQLKEIKFEDDSIINEERCTEFCEEILKNNLKFIWSINSRADVSLKMLKLMRKAGCRLVCVGVESGDQALLNSIKKNIKIDQIRQFMKDTKKAGLLVHGCFLVGAPGETKETLKTTLSFAIELEPDTAQFFPISYYPGTTAYKWAQDNGFLVTNDFSRWLTSDGMLSSVVSRPGLSNKELVDFCDDSRLKFYLRPKYLFRKLTQCIVHPFEAQRTFKALSTFRKHLFKRHVESVN